MASLVDLDGCFGDRVAYESSSSLAHIDEVSEHNRIEGENESEHLYPQISHGIAIGSFAAAGGAISSSRSSSNHGINDSSKLSVIGKNSPTKSRLSQVHNHLKGGEDRYWRYVEGLTKEEKGELFAMILRSERVDTRSAYQLRFLHSQCMQIEFFQNIEKNYGEQVVLDCLPFLKYSEYDAAQTLFEQGERGTRFFIILEGIVEVLIRLPDKSDKDRFVNQQINKIGAGLAFGEVGLMNDNAKRSATIRTLTPCSFAYLEKVDFNYILKYEATQKINERYSFIKEYVFFDDFNYRDLITFSYHFNEEPFQRGDMVYDALDLDTDDVFFVKEGTFMLQAVFETAKWNIPNIRAKKISKQFNIYPLLERSIFGLELFNIQMIKAIQDELREVDKSSHSLFPTKFAFTTDSSEEFKPFRLGRVICDSTRGVLYRVKANEFEKRLWREESREKFQQFQQLAFDKQAERMKNLLTEFIQERAHIDLMEEQGKYLKKSVEYLGKSTAFGNAASMKGGTQSMILDMAAIAASTSNNDHKSIDSTSQYPNQSTIAVSAEYSRRCSLLLMNFETLFRRNSTQQQQQQQQQQLLQSQAPHQQQQASSTSEFLARLAALSPPRVSVRIQKQNDLNSSTIFEARRGFSIRSQIEKAGDQTTKSNPSNNITNNNNNNIHNTSNANNNNNNNNNEEEDNDDDDDDKDSQAQFTTVTIDSPEKKHHLLTSQITFASPEEEHEYNSLKISRHKAKMRSLKQCTRPKRVTPIRADSSAALLEERRFIKSMLLEVKQNLHLFKGTPLHPETKPVPSSTSKNSFRVVLPSSSQLRCDTTNTKKIQSPEFNQIGTSTSLFSSTIHKGFQDHIIEDFAPRKRNQSCDSNISSSNSSSSSNSISSSSDNNINAINNSNRSSNTSTTQNQQNNQIKQSTDNINQNQVENPTELNNKLIQLNNESEQVISPGEILAPSTDLPSSSRPNVELEARVIISATSTFEEEQQMAFSKPTQIESSSSSTSNNQQQPRSSAVGLRGEEPRIDLKKIFISRASRQFQLNKQLIQQQQLAQQQQQAMLKPRTSAKEVVNEVFYFCKSRNRKIAQEREMTELKRSFIDKVTEPIVSQKSQKSQQQSLKTKKQIKVKGISSKGGIKPFQQQPTLRGVGDALCETDEDLNIATTLEEYKRLKFERRLRSEQSAKFEKLFSMELVELSRASEASMYSKAVEELYADNKRKHKMMFDSTACIVKEMNGSYRQVREYFNKLNHTDRLFQDLFIQKNISFEEQEAMTATSKSTDHASNSKRSSSVSQMSPISKSILARAQKARASLSTKARNSTLSRNSIIAQVVAQQQQSTSTNNNQTSNELDRQANNTHNTQRKIQQSTRGLNQTERIRLQSAHQTMPIIGTITPQTNIAILPMTTSQQSNNNQTIKKIERASSFGSNTSTNGVVILNRDMNNNQIVNETPENDNLNVVDSNTQMQGETSIVNSQIIGGESESNGESKLDEESSANEEREDEMSSSKQLSEILEKNQFKSNKINANRINGTANSTIQSPLLAAAESVHAKTISIATGGTHAHHDKESFYQLYGSMQSQSQSQPNWFPSVNNISNNNNSINEGNARTQEYMNRTMGHISAGRNNGGHTMVATSTISAAATRSPSSTRNSRTRSTTTASNQRNSPMLNMRMQHMQRVNTANAGASCHSQQQQDSLTLGSYSMTMSFSDSTMITSAPNVATIAFESPEKAGNSPNRKRRSTNNYDDVSVTKKAFLSRAMREVKTSTSVRGSRKSFI